MSFRGLLAVTLVLASLACERIGKETKKAFPPEFQPPTASEVFTIRTKCAEMVAKMEEDMAHGAAIAQDATSRYDPKSNRCFALITTRTIDPKYGNKVGSYLYDAQTKELLAWATRDGTKRDAHNFVTGADDYANVSEWIGAKMQEDYK